MSNLSHEIMIPSISKSATNDNEDRLSDLPECVLLHILSFLDSKPAVQTCILSTRWKHLWKRIPTLILHTSNFRILINFSVFLSNILTLRDGSTALHTLDINQNGRFEPDLLKKFLNYVYSHNTHLQQLKISLRGDMSLITRCVSSCRALTSLKLSLRSRGRHNIHQTLFPKCLDLPALTNLYLKKFAFYGENGFAEPFSALTRLNTLVLCRCSVKDAQIFSISNPMLVNLTLDENYPFSIKIELSSPSLCTFTFMGSLTQRICGSGLSSIKKVNIDAEIYITLEDHPLNPLSWLQAFANIESLTVTSITLQVLSLVPDLLEVKLPSLSNLKSLNVKLVPLQFYSLTVMKDAMLKQAAAKSSYEAAKLQKAFDAGFKPPPIPDGIVEFFRKNSPSVKVNITPLF